MRTEEIEKELVVSSLYDLPDKLQRLYSKNLWVRHDCGERIVNGIIPEIVIKKNEEEVSISIDFSNSAKALINILRLLAIHESYFFRFRVKIFENERLTKTVESGCWIGDANIIARKLVDIACCHGGEKKSSIDIPDLPCNSDSKSLEL